VNASAASAGDRRGRFVTFEGIEGTGKTTQLERLAARLRGGGVDVFVTREPGGTALGRELRAVLLRPTGTAIAPLAELLLYVADRAQHLEQIVLPALQRGAIVLCDRYTDATLAYQGYGRELGLDWIRRLHARAPLDLLPDRTILLELDPAVALARARRREAARGDRAGEDRFERERLEFHRRVADGYAALASEDPVRVRRVDGAGSPDDVEGRVRGALCDLLPLAAVDAC
jgi:dTMP kinase